MATFTKFNPFVENLAEGVCTLDDDDKYVCLVNTAPTSSNGVFTDLTEITAGNGYTAGGNKANLTSSAQTSGTYKLVLADPATWTASAGSIGPFRYAVLYQNSGTKPLIGYWDYGSSITLAAGETFTVDFDASTGVLQLV
jgi:hypothetical protein